MDTGHRQVLAILMINKLFLKVNVVSNSYGKSAADTVAVEVCPNTVPIL